MQFDEEPIGTIEDADLGLLPEGEAVQSGRHRSGEGSVVESGAERTQGTSKVGYEGTLDHQGENLGGASGNEIATPAMGRGLIKRKSTFVDGIYFFYLSGMGEAAGHGQVSITASIGKNLHFGIDAAETSVGGVGEREISVNKGVAGTSGTCFHGEATMAKGEVVAEFREGAACVFGKGAACVFGGVGLRRSVVQVNLDFSPASMAVLGEHLEQALVVLLGGIEVGVDERAAIEITPAVDDFGIFADPRFEAALLLGTRGALRAATGSDGGFEMIGEDKDEVDGAAGWRVEGAPGRGWEDSSGIGELVLETHVSLRCPAP
jgi:hypothetical protein